MPAQVYVHYNVKTAEGKLLLSTWQAEGGAGLPLPFIVGAGRRAPRAWEIAMLSEPLRLNKPSSCSAYKLLDCHKTQRQGFSAKQRCWQRHPTRHVVLEPHLSRVLWKTWFQCLLPESLLQTLGWAR